MLATTAKTQGVSAYDSRIAPIMQTWGAYFPHLYFVFGTNVFDYKFLDSKCTVRSESGDGISDKKPGPSSAGLVHRRLVPHTPQTKPKDSWTLYDCPYNHYIDTSNSSVYTQGSGETQTLQALWIGNCTGEYFGEYIGALSAAQV
jgi:hypothetical protein